LAAITVRDLRTRIAGANAADTTLRDPSNRDSALRTSVNEDAQLKNVDTPPSEWSLPAP
jgi:hypothetical protein